MGHEKKQRLATDFSFSACIFFDYDLSLTSKSLKVIESHHKSYIFIMKLFCLKLIILHNPKFRL